MPEAPGCAGGGIFQPIEPPGQLRFPCFQVQRLHTDLRTGQVQNAFAGIRACVCVLIFNATLKLWQGAVKDVGGALIFAAVLAASLLTDLSPVLFVLAAAVAGIILRNVVGAKI